MTVAGQTTPTREEIDAWLEAACGKGLPHGEANNTASMLHGLAYILRQIEGTDRYMVNIGQTTSATSALRMALDRFAVEALTGSALTELHHRRETPEGWVLVPREPTEAMLLARWPSYHPWGDNAPPPADRATMWDEMVKKTKALWAAMLAASPSSPASGVRVKALEWSEVTSPRLDGPPEPTGDWEGNGVTGAYSVYLLDGYFEVTRPDDSYVEQYLAGVDEAKAAAQSDYEALIISALGEHP